MRPFLRDAGALTFLVTVVSVAFAAAFLGADLAVVTFLVVFLVAIVPPLSTNAY